MDFFCACLAELGDFFARGGAAYDGVVYHDNALAAHDFVNRRKFDGYAGSALALLGLDESATDVVVADEAEVERDAACVCVADGRGVAAVGHGDDHVGLNGIFARELRAQALAGFVDVLPEDKAVGPGEVDQFEDAMGRSNGFRRRKTIALHSPFGAADHFAGFDVAQVARADLFERAGFGGDDGGAVELSEAEGADAAGVAYGDHFVGREDEERVGPAQAVEGVGEFVVGIGQAGIGECVHDYFCVHARLENCAMALIFRAEGRGVDEVAVVGYSELAAGIAGGEGLRVFDAAGAGGGVAYVADGCAVAKFADDFGGERLADVAHGAVICELRAVGRGDTAAFFAPVLERVESEIAKPRRFLVAENAKQPAGFSGFVRHWHTPGEGLCGKKQIWASQSKILLARQRR